MNDIKVINNKDLLRLEVTLDGEYGYVDYRFYKMNIAFMHTFMPDAFTRVKALHLKCL